MFYQTNALRRSRAQQRSRAQCRAQQRGQSIVIALLVLLLLGLAGALFVTIVARNIVNAQHASRVVTADQYARAGITFADTQLSTSLDGADWRSPLQFALSDGTNGTTDNRPSGVRERARYNALGLGAVPANDPDLKYLQAGFTRYNTGAGRFLLRVTYDPVNIGVGTPAVPAPVAPGKYIKIESIGREGVIDAIDPTTYTNNRTTDRTQAYQVAFKPIAITDYAKFETNLQNRADFANIGVTSTFYATNIDGGIATPGVYDFSAVSATGVTLQEYPVVTVYGAPDAYKVAGTGFLPNPTAGTATTINQAANNAVQGGGSFHANMPVRFFGENVVYLNPNVGANAPLYQDTVEVAGDLLLNGYTQANPLFSTSVAGTGQRTALILNPTDLASVSAGASTNDTTNNSATTNAYIVPSNDNPAQGAAHGGFSTHGGLVRDGSSGNDPNGLPRGVGRLDPPLMDATESGSKLPRYKAIATLSPPRLDPQGAVYIPGASQYGYGQSIYINNVDDIQDNSKTIGGGSTLVDQWMNRTAGAFDSTKGGWNGDFYEPPGVNITLGRQIVDPAVHTGGYKSTFGVRMTLTKGQWPNPDGTNGTQATQTVLFDDLYASNDPAVISKTNPDNDVVIYAEGNVRVHGIVSADPADPDTSLTTQDKYPRHVTIVTNGTAYIEGSLLKGNPNSSITILAHDYVCVNTTQFLAGPQADEALIGPALKNYSDPSNPNYNALVFGSDGTQLVQDLTVGLPTGGTPQAAYGGLLGLYVSASPGGTDPSGTKADFDLVNPATGYSVRGANVLPFGLDKNNQTSIWSPTFNGTNQRQYLNLNPATATVNPLTPITDFSITPNTALTNLVESDVRRLYTRLNTGSSQDLRLERITVLPSDVRIEAVLYAQTGSFFVIPGYWFDSDSTDNMAAFSNTFAANAPNGQRLNGADAHFPFYGQPIDMKITIDGAVSEAQPADVANQTAWMLKWGWIPQYHGYASLASPPTGAPLEPAGHVLPPDGYAPKPAIGLQIIYNPQAGYPYDPGDGTAADPPHYLRSDQFGRPLPFSPKLPVSTALLYAGESSEPPLLL